MKAFIESSVGDTSIQWGSGDSPTSTSTLIDEGQKSKIIEEPKLNYSCDIEKLKQKLKGSQELNVS